MSPTVLYKETTVHGDLTFLFLLQAIVERYRDVVRRELPHIHMHSRGSGLTWPEHFGSLTTIGSSLIFSKRFVSVICPVCDATYSPESTQVIEFHEGEALAAYGGRRLLCPQGHPIFTLGEWTS